VIPQPHGLDVVATPLGGGLPPGAGRRTAAAAVRAGPHLGPAFLAYGAAQDNLKRLLAGGLCVTTGQQPGLLTGPLYGVYKALSAVALARAASARVAKDVVPVFWVAGDDHDFAEGNHTYVLTGANEVQRIALREREPEAPLTPLYREPVGGEIAGVLEAVRGALPETEFRGGVLEWLARHYRPEADLAEAYAQAMAELLGPYGLVVFRPTHAAAKRAMAPWLLRLLDQAGPLGQALVATAGALERGGHPTPVAVDEAATLVMIEDALGRDRLLRDGDAFVTRRGGSRFSRTDLQRIAAEEPGRLSPNVLARPVIEAALLPTLAYVAGPGELAYLPQAAPVYDALDAVRQAAVPRWSGMLLEGRVRKVLDKYHIAPEALNRPAGQLEASLVAEELPPAVRDTLAALRNAVNAGYPRLAEAAAAVDPTLRKPIESTMNATLGGLGNVEKRILVHLKSQNEILLQQLDKARANLFPLGQPQERVFNVCAYLVRYGMDFPGVVLAACAEHAAALETILADP
jgi:bacillithiol biosynthesis cysteine-adding enzyme BshC